MFKNIAGKPIIQTGTYRKFGLVLTEYEKYLCPRCKTVLNAGPDYQPKYCDRCGQRISFGGVKWKGEREHLPEPAVSGNAADGPGDGDG